MDTVLLFVILGNTLVLLGVGAITLTSVRKLGEALSRVEETAARGERMTARVLTMLAGIEEHDQ